jgi:hypothetical protein
MANVGKTIVEERQATIIEQYGGICPAYEAFYIHAIIYAAERSESAFQRFEATVAESDSPARILACVQEALTHAGALSRFFWPAKANALTEARGKRFRQTFGISDASPLKLRELRNTFEHFDEKLDRFLLRGPVGCFFPSPLVGSCGSADDAIVNVFKLADPVQGICVLLGERFEFHPIRCEVQRVLALALEMDERGCRLARTDKIA